MAEKTKSEWILIVAGGILQLPAVKAAHELGYKVVVTDRDPDCACASLADKFVRLDTFDVKGHINFVDSWPHDFAAVFTAGADPIVTVARAAQAAGCHGLDPAIAGMCADKVKTRLRLSRFNVPQPLFSVVTASDKGHHYNHSTDFAFKASSLIVKATSSSGSRGHTQLHAPDSQPAVLLKDLNDATRKALQYSRSNKVLVEELMTGKELSVETLWYNGEMIPLNAVERPFIKESAYAIELGHYNPAVLDAGDYAAVWDIMRQAGCAVGMDETSGGHILKGDLMLTDDGPQVLELTTRLSGGFDSGWTTPLAHGADYTKGALLLALGEPLERAMPYFAKRWSRHAACLAVRRPEGAGVIRRLEVRDDAPECVKFIMRFGVGEFLPPLIDCTGRIGFCIVEGETHRDAVEIADYWSNYGVRLEVE